MKCKFIDIKNQFWVFIFFMNLSLGKKEYNMTITSVSFNGSLNKPKNNTKKVVGLALGTAAILGGAYALGRTSPQFWVRTGGRTPEGVLWDGYKMGNPPFVEGVKEGFKKLPKLVKSITEVIADKSVVADAPSKTQRIKDILLFVFKPIGK